MPKTPLFFSIFRFAVVESFFFFFLPEVDFELRTGKMSFSLILTKEPVIWFGNYFKFCKNCQNFWDKYVEAIGLKKAKSLTDDDMSAIAAILTGILVFFLFLFALGKSLIRNERRKTQ